MSQNQANTFRQEVMGVFRYLRSQGRRGTFMADAHWIVIVGTYQFEGVPDNDN